MKRGAVLLLAIGILALCATARWYYTRGGGGDGGSAVSELSVTVGGGGSTPSASRSAEPHALPYRIFVYPLPASYHSDLLDRNTGLCAYDRPLEYEQYATETIVHRTLLTLRTESAAPPIRPPPAVAASQHIWRSPRVVVTDDPTRADLFFVPAYSLCFMKRYMARHCPIERRSVSHCERLAAAADAATPNAAAAQGVDTIDSHDAETSVSPRRAVNRFMRSALAEVQRFGPYWARRRGRDHIFVWPHGYGANDFPDWEQTIRHSIFLTPEGNGRHHLSPPSPISSATTPPPPLSHDEPAQPLSFFRFEWWKDVVIPGFVASANRLLALGRTRPAIRDRSILCLFRGFVYDYEDGHTGVDTARARLIRHAEWWNKQHSSAAAAAAAAGGAAVRVSTELATPTPSTDTPHTHSHIRSARHTRSLPTTVIASHFGGYGLSGDSFTSATVSDYADELSRSLFCVIVRGMTLWTRRLYEAILAGCIPVIVNDDLILPFADQFRYERFTIRINERTAFGPPLAHAAAAAPAATPTATGTSAGALLPILASLSTAVIERKLTALDAVKERFRWRLPPLATASASASAPSSSSAAEDDESDAFDWLLVELERKAAHFRTPSDVAAAYDLA